MSPLPLPWSIHYLQAGRVCMKHSFSNLLPVLPCLLSSHALFFLRLSTASKDPVSCTCSIKDYFFSESRKNKGCSKERTFRLAQPDELHWCSHVKCCQIRPWSRVRWKTRGFRDGEKQPFCFLKWGLWVILRLLSCKSVMSGLNKILESSVCIWRY